MALQPNTFTGVGYAGYVASHVTITGFAIVFDLLQLFNYKCRQTSRQTSNLAITIRKPAPWLPALPCWFLWKLGWSGPFFHGRPDGAGRDVEG